MSKDHDHEERGLLGRLRRRRAGTSTPSTNLFTARATDAASPVPPPAEPPPERLFEGLDRWDQQEDDHDGDAPLFSEASLDTSPTVDEPAAPPPPAPVPPLPTDPVPELPSDEPDAVDELFSAAPSAGTTDAEAPSEPDTDQPGDLPAPPPPVDFWATPVRPTTPPADLPVSSDEDLAAAPPPSGITPVDAPAPSPADTPTAEDVPPPPPPVAPPSDPVVSWTSDAPPAAPPTDVVAPLDPLSESQRPGTPDVPEDLAGSVAPLDPLAAEARDDADLGATAPTSSVAPLDPLAEPVTATTGSPELSDLTDELQRYATEEPEEVEETPTGLWSHLAAPFERATEPAGPSTEPDEPLFGSSAPRDERIAEPSPLMDQVAAEFGDPRAQLFRMVEADPDDVPPAATAATAPAPTEAPTSPTDGLPMTGAEPAAVAPVEEPATGTFPVAPQETDEAADSADHDEPEPWVHPAEDPATAPAATTPATPARSEEPWEAPATEAAPAATTGATPGDASGTSQPAAPRPTGAVPLGTEPATHGPSIIRVHDDRLDNRPGPIKMSPSEAVALAEEGHSALNRRRKPS